MNWFDIVILVIVALAVWKGVSTGLIGAAIVAVGGIIGWLLAGQLSDDVGGMFDSLPFDTFVTMAAYAVIVAAAIVAALFISKLVKPVLTAATLGLSSMVDKIGGLVLGLILGLAVAGALIVTMARLTYDFELPDVDTGPVDIYSRVPVEETRESLENVLAESVIVASFVNVVDALPGSALGLAPSDFGAAIEILGERIDEE